MIKMPGEERLLLTFTLMRLGGKEVEEAADIIRKGISWERFVVLARSNRIFPQSFEHLTTVLQAHRELSPPEGIYRGMKAAYSHLSAQKMILLAESKKALSALSDARLDFTPFKGFIIEGTAYPKDVSRDFSDLDLLMRDEGERSRAQAILENMGYRKLLSGSDAYHVKMTKPKFGIEVAIELHMQLPGMTHLYPYPTIDGFWERLEAREVGGIKLRVMRPESMFLVTSLNAFRDGEVKLKDLSDLIALTSDGASFDWGAVRRSLSDVGWGSMLALPVSAYASAMHSLGKQPPPVPAPIKLDLSEKSRTFFPIKYSYVCDLLGCAGRRCRSCPLLIQKKVPPITDLLSISDAFRTFPSRAMVSATLLVTCVRRECGAQYAIRCSALMARYLLNVFAYMLKLTALRRKE